MLLNTEPDALEISNGLSGYTIFSIDDFTDKQLIDLSKWCIVELQKRNKGIKHD